MSEITVANGTSLQHVGIAMYVLADTWAHTFFAGTPSSESATLCASAPLSTFSNKKQKKTPAVTGVLVSAFTLSILTVRIHNPGCTEPR